jgi:hypothetical protein
LIRRGHANPRLNPSRFDYPRRLSYIIYLLLQYHNLLLSDRNDISFNIN